ncbi:BrnA antitoxin family protein [candidate division TA06 bacterium]|uniref:BrnA antitoxin family protein n=1 Tax=candidate division TA06 bacterium TaxID=2250710 RepID=A0A933MJP7_UNCT6|nr:BrnA antitoxin family protein [candidate division TA06 bacterium]
MKKLKKIPVFKTPGAEEKFWAAHDSADYVDYTTARPALFTNLKPSSRTISIRLPESLLEALKQLANKQDVPYQSMLKMLLADKVGEKMQLKSR